MDDLPSLRKMMFKAVSLAAAVLLMPVASAAAPFGLAAVLRAGDLFTDNLRLGSTSASAPAATAGFFPFWLDGVDHDFQLSYNAATNLANLSASWLGIFTSTVSWNPVGGVPGSVPRAWSIGAGDIRLTAQNNPTSNTSVRIQNLSISGPGLSVINPPNLTAAQTGSGTVTAANSAPIVFITPNGGGSWVLNGQIRFTGLYGTPFSTGDSLRVAFDFLSSDVPEASSLLMGALGLAALGVLHQYRVRRLRRRLKLAASVKAAAPSVD
jgi:hypothetical protein